MKRFFYIIVITIMVFCSCSKEGKTESASPVDTIPMIVMQIQKCSHLHTAECKIHKIITHKDQMALRGTLFSKDFNLKLPVGQRNVAIPIDATIKAWIDFSQISEDNVVRNGDKIQITLPDPQVEITASKIRHDKVQKRVSILRTNFTDEELTTLEKQGRKAIEKDIPRLGLTALARQNAARIIIPIIEQLGFEEQNITVVFASDNSNNTITREKE